MKKKVILCLFAVTLVVMACALQLIQQPGQELMQHPWQGKRVAYFGDSITDPGNNGSKKKYWGFLQDWLQIEPYEGHARLAKTIMQQLIVLPIY